MAVGINGQGYCAMTQRTMGDFDLQISGIKKSGADPLVSIIAMYIVAKMDEAPGKKQKQPSQVVFVLPLTIDCIP